MNLVVAKLEDNKVETYEAQAEKENGRLKFTDVDGYIREINEEDLGETRKFFFHSDRIPVAIAKTKAEALTALRDYYAEKAKATQKSAGASKEAIETAKRELSTINNAIKG